MISVVLPVLAPSPFLRAMTEFCIKTLRLHADNPFELILVEAEQKYFDPNVFPQYITGDLKIDQYLNFNPKIGGVREMNAGMRAATGDFIVTCGNDVIVPPHWDRELLRPFELYPNCGVSALSAFEPGAVIGPAQAMPLIVEGMYSPFNMFRKGWEYDESYLRVYQDSDLIMRIYEANLVPYRNCNAHVHHLLRMTNDRVDTQQHNYQLAKDEELFYARWGKSPRAMFGLIRSSQYAFSKEFASFVAPINAPPNHPANTFRPHF